MQYRIAVVMIAVAALSLSGCASPDNSVGRYKVGKPYRIGGKMYYPEENYTGTQTGVASWYGPGFHGKKTANGERFDEDALTAAHPTLQMPSLVNVTNLENGQSVILRVNDRGPFHGGRIIDTSKAGAEALGFRMNGTARVRVQVLGPESQILAAAAKRGVDTRGSEIAMNTTGTLDERFAPFYPTYVAAPQPDVMVAATTYQPPVPAGQIIAPQTLAVPKPEYMPMQETIVVAEAVPPVHIPAPAPPIYQMAPVADDAGMPGVPVATLEAADVKPLARPNLMPEHPAFLGVSNTRIFVQAGANMTRAAASKLREQVADLGPASVVPSAANGLPYFKVRIGPLESVEKADHVVNTLQRQGRQASVVVGQN